ncbi:MAG: hypothetical protein K8R36_05615 [Planctomycetales bacterium]|nr:hypothetical protein [Planctomycetales bacterium]
MDRRNWFARVFSAFVVPLVWPAMRLMAQDAPMQATLEERLKSGLLCRRPEEFVFVARVADKVEAVELPQDMVLNAMKYALRKRPKFPFFYFQAVIFRQADALGVNLGDPIVPMPQ